MTDQTTEKARNDHSGLFLFGWALTAIGAGAVFGLGGFLMAIGLVLMVAVMVDDLAEKIRTRS